jgi:tRNA (Thr-GGU) A37 N-methylase
MASVSFDVRPIGYVHSSRTDAIDDDWDMVASFIELDQEVVGAHAVLGLDEFSHVDVVFLFDQVDPEQVQTGARRPRNNPDWPMVAQRAKMRPNRIGVTSCRLLGVEGLTVRLAGLDAIDGTPVLDLKPVMNEFLPRGEIIQPPWATELMRGYWRRS